MKCPECFVDMKPIVLSSVDFTETWYECPKCGYKVRI